MQHTRMVSVDDAPALADLLRRNREFLAPFEPDRDDATSRSRARCARSLVSWRSIAMAFGELGLHRVEAGTLLDNLRSQLVLERNGFVRFGVAPALHIAGGWRDHAMCQKMAT